MMSLKLQNFGAMKNKKDLFDSFLSFAVNFSFLIFCLSILTETLIAPLSNWNATRLSWTFSIVNGYDFFYNPGQGPIITRIYGPLFPIAYFLATVAKTPTMAIILGSLLSVCMSLLPLIVLIYKAGRKRLRESLFIKYAAACFFFFATFNNTLRYVTFSIHPDAPAIGLAMTACLFIFFMRDAKRQGWMLFLSAVFTALSFWTKQTMLVLCPSLAVYLLITEGKKKCLTYLVYCGLIFALSLAAFSCLFGLEKLIYNMFLLPGKHPYLDIFYFPLGAPQGFGNDAFWGREPPIRYDCPVPFLRIALAQFLENSLLPFFILVSFCCRDFKEILTQKKRFADWSRDNRWSLFLLISTFSIPISIMGRMKAGGDINAFEPAVYFLTSAICVIGLERIPILIAQYQARQRKALKLFFAYLILLCCVSYGLPSLVYNTLLLKDVRNNEHEIAFRYILKHPGKIYFFENMLSHLMAEGKLYHTIDGLMDKYLAGEREKPRNFYENVPGGLEYIALSSASAFPLRYQFVMYSFPEFSKKAPVEGLTKWVIYKKQDSTNDLWK